MSRTETMHKEEDAKDSGPANLSEITTRWSSINEPLQFVARYAAAIRKYFSALISNPADAEEACQEFLLRVVKTGFLHACPERGRFRDYLKTAVRNAARSYLRRGPKARITDIASIPAPGARTGADQVWLAEWRDCVLQRAWHSLETHQRSVRGNLYHTILQLVADHPGETSEALAARVSALAGRPISPEAFRQQLNRGRHLFAEMIVLEVGRTLKDPTPDQLEEELVETGLMDFLRDFLPADWSWRNA
jgi:hypothetical protein